MLSYLLDNQQDTLAIAAKLADNCPTDSVLFLSGELGTGKTTLVGGFLQALGFQGIVKSPSYTLIETYHIKNQSILHWDLYRLKMPQELEGVGIRDYTLAPAIWLIEWPERGLPFLPAADLTIVLQLKNKQRSIQLNPQTPKGQQLLETFHE
jgi:tRNA threonylcarbamoyladenosine biosynthesis protein TsaE